MIFAVLLMVALVLFMLGGVLPVAGAEPGVVYRTPTFIALLGLLCLSILWCCRKYLSWRRLGFLVSHVAVVVILAGALVGYVLGRKTNVPLPVSIHHEIQELRHGEDQPIPLDFGVACVDFRVEHYEPHYSIYRPTGAGAPDEPNASPYEFVRKVSVADAEFLELESGERVPVTELHLETVPETWREQYRTDKDWVLQLTRSVRHYGATLRFRDKEGRTEDQHLAVNHPAEFGGWRFYLMDYDQDMQRYIWVSARRDPGRWIVIAGLWVMIAGVALLCWFEQGRSSRA